MAGGDVTTPDVHRTTRLVPVSGVEFTIPTHAPRFAGDVVFVPWSTIDAVLDQGRWDSQIRAALFIPAREAAALVAYGIAEAEMFGGYHHTERAAEIVAGIPGPEIDG
jgi:hypothetical protein